MSRSMFVVMVAVALTTAGCGWVQQDFDAGRSRANPFETSLTVGNVGSLVGRSMPSVDEHLVAVLGRQLIVQRPTAVVAYDAGSCPRADGQACTPVWTRPDSQWRASDGTSVMVFTSSGTIDVTDLNRAPLWSGVPGLTGGQIPRVAITGGRIVVGNDLYGGHGSTTEDVDVFPVVGCGAATCSPTFVVHLGSSFETGRWAVGGDSLLTDDGPGLTVRSLATGATTWTASGDFMYSPPSAIVHGDDVIVTEHVGTSYLTRVFDRAGVRGCSGSPAVCTPLRTLNAAGTLHGSADAVHHVLVGGSDNGDGTANRTLAIFAADGAGCTTTCAPVASTTPVTTWSTQGYLRPVQTPNLVLAVGVPVGLQNRTFHLLAYDANLTAGCGGSPKVCQPVADVPFAVGDTNDISDLIVWNGVVYVQTLTTLYSFSLPTS